MEPLFPNNDDSDLGNEDIIPELSERTDVPAIPEAENIPLEQLVCDICFEQTLTESVNVAKCVSCDENYCIHNASLVDASHCKECLHDVHVDFEVIRRVDVYTNAQGVKSAPRSRTARQIKLGGMHWLFKQRQIPNMSDTDLAIAIEYHRATYDSLIYEREVRRSQYAHRNAGRQVKFSPADLTSVIPSTTSTTIKKTKRMQAAKPDKAAAALAKAFEAMKAAGIDPAAMAAMLSGKK